MSVLGLGDVSLSVVMGRMVDHPCRATGPFISFPVRGLRPIRLQAGSCMRIMSSSFLCSFSSWTVACFFLCMLSWAILIGRVVSEGCSFILRYTRSRHQGSTISSSVMNSFRPHSYLFHFVVFYLSFLIHSNTISILITLYIRSGLLSVVSHCTD